MARQAMRLELTRQAEHAIRAMVWLAQVEAQHQAAGTTVPRQKAAAIAHAASIPPAFASRVLAQLRHQGLLRARAGKQGGYSLTRPARAISLLEIIEAVEGPLLAQECLLRDGTCGTTGYCVLHAAWSAAHEALRQVLAEMSPADVVAQQEPANAGERKRTPRGSGQKGGATDGTHS